MLSRTLAHVTLVEAGSVGGAVAGSATVVTGADGTSAEVATDVEAVVVGDTEADGTAEAVAGRTADNSSGRVEAQPVTARANTSKARSGRSALHRSITAEVTVVVNYDQTGDRILEHVDVDMLVRDRAVCPAAVPRVQLECDAIRDRR